MLISARDRSPVQDLAVAKDCPRLATVHTRYRPVSTEGQNLTLVSQQSAVWTLAKTLEDFGTVHGRQDSATDCAWHIVRQTANGMYSRAFKERAGERNRERNKQTETERQTETKTGRHRENSNSKTS